MGRKCNKDRKSLKRKFFEQKLKQNTIQFAIVAEGMRSKMARKDELRGAAVEAARQNMELPPCPPVCIEGEVIAEGEIV